MNLRLAIITAIALGGTALAAEAAHADCTWTIRGKIQIEDDINALDRGTHPIRNARVELSRAAYETWGYDVWGETRTRDDGTFSRTFSGPCNDRWVKVKVRFQDHDLDVQAKVTGEHWPGSSAAGAQPGSSTPGPSPSPTARPRTSSAITITTGAPSPG